MIEVVHSSVASKEMLKSKFVLRNFINKLLPNCCIRFSKWRLIRFMFGAFLSYLCFFMMITQMDISLTLGAWLSSIISLYLCFGMAYSKNFQYVFFNDKIVLEFDCKAKFSDALRYYFYLKFAVNKDDQC